MPSTTIYSPGELLLVDFPHTSGTNTERRPALVLLDAGDDDVVLARVTTQYHPMMYDVPIVDWPGAGLIAPSYVRLHKIATLAKWRVVRRLGILQSSDHAQVSAILQQMFGNW